MQYHCISSFIFVLRVALITNTKSKSLGLGSKYPHELLNVNFKSLVLHILEYRQNVTGKTPIYGSLLGKFNQWQKYLSLLNVESKISKMRVGPHTTLIQGDKTYFRHFF